MFQEVKSKYLSYDDQLKTLIQTGNTITKQLQDGKYLILISLNSFLSANEDSTEHESSLKILETRWQELHKQILQSEQDIEQFIIESQFNDEYQALTKARNEYQTWIDSTSSSNSSTEIQVELTREDKIN
jgi:hypothetical protein